VTTKKGITKKKMHITIKPDSSDSDQAQGAKSEAESVDS